jgi:hypothetical protein
VLVAVDGDDDALGEWACKADAATAGVEAATLSTGGGDGDDAGLADAADAEGGGAFEAHGAEEGAVVVGEVFVDDDGDVADGEGAEGDGGGVGGGVQGGGGVYHS